MLIYQVITCKEWDEMPIKKKKSASSRRRSLQRLGEPRQDQKDPVVLLRTDENGIKYYGRKKIV